MAARSVRRSFASPFVITLAAALPAAACYVQPGPQRSGGSGTHATGGGQSTGTPDEPGHVNPPRPKQPPMENMPGTNAGAEQAPPAGNTTVIANPPRPGPVPVAKQDRRWTVTRASGACSAYVSSTCPKPPPGQPAPSCNPPPAMAYTCPATMADNSMIAVVQFAGQNTCQVEHPPIKCPAGAICNPPPPQKVACPQ